MHFDTKSYLKNTRNHTAKHILNGLGVVGCEERCVDWTKSEEKKKEPCLVVMFFPLSSSNCYLFHTSPD